MKTFRRLAAHAVFLSRGLLRNGVVTLDAEGTVVHVGQEEGIDSLPGVEFYAGILVPGMVNAHTHLELSYMKGMIPPGCGYPGFATGMRDKRGAADDKQRVEVAGYYDARMWADGISAAGDISNGTTTFEIKRNSAILYHTFAEAFGLDDGAAGNAVRIKGMARRMGLAATVTPHATYSLNEKAFAEVVGEDAGSPVSIHFMESGEEEALFLDGGGLGKWYGEQGMATDFTDKYSGPADRIIKTISPDRKIMLIHNTFVGELEVDMLAGHFGSNLTWVLCPRSNMYITGKLPPVAMLWKSGGRIALGTDSLASNESLSLVGEMKMFPEIPLEQLLRWATLSGAEALGVEDTYGSFDAGKRPGAVLIEGVDWDNMKLTDRASSRRIV